MWPDQVAFLSSSLVKRQKKRRTLDFGFQSSATTAHANKSLPRQPGAKGPITAALSAIAPDSALLPNAYVALSIDPFSPKLMTSPFRYGISGALRVSQINLGLAAVAGDIR